jgi:hypothetical protein
MAIVVPFPRARDRGFVRRQASLMARYSRAAAEKHLSQQLALQERTLQRRGVDAELIEEHLRQLEHCILAELWRQGGALSNRNRPGGVT